MPTLLDRSQEKEALDELLGAVRAGLSGAVVLVGEAGVGKTALLDYAAASAGAEMEVVRVVGIESETEFGFAALHQLVVPFVGRLERLPAPQTRGARFPRSAWSRLLDPPTFSSSGWPR